MSSLFRQLRRQPTTEEATQAAKDLRITTLAETSMVLGQASAAQLMELASDTEIGADDALRCVLAGMALQAACTARLERASGDRIPVSADSFPHYLDAAAQLLEGIE